MMDSILTSSQLKRLQNSIVDSLPFCSGTLPVTPNDLAVFYGKDENARRVSLHRPPLASLDGLVRSCEPATFGRGKEDVYDESYRKAGKLGSDAFRPMLDVYDIGLVDLISEILLRGSHEGKVIRAELYNMNVYGEGSFFKAHVDTPRGENMFGSLVIFYPIAHEGGTLLMRKNGKEWSFDSSNVLANNEEPHLGYVALYSDVEHEVLPVTSGHRVTITYNLFFHEIPSLPIPISSASVAGSFKSTLVALLSDPEFLPDGGHLGFSLDSECAYPKHTKAGCSLHALEKYLKGVDADVMQIFKELALEPSLWAIIDYNDDMIGCKGIIPIYEGKRVLQENPVDMVSEKLDDRIIKKNSKGKEPDFHCDVAWIREPERDDWRRQSFIGCEEPDSVYHTVCILAEVGKAGNRATPDVSGK